MIRHLMHLPHRQTVVVIQLSDQHQRYKHDQLQRLEAASLSDVAGGEVERGLEGAWRELLLAANVEQVVDDLRWVGEIGQVRGVVVVD